MSDLKISLTGPCRLMVSALIFLVSLNSFSQEPLPVTKITGGITFDGVPDEDVWKQVPSLKMIMHMPVFGNEPSESSVIKIAFDEDYLYISGMLNYKDPLTIRAIGKKRDYATPSCDWFGVVLDSFFDRENAVAFWTNPNGIRSDATVKNDLADSNSDISFSWNTFWDVKTVINGNGWSAEFRIPFSSLRFQVKDGKSFMGITILRYDAAKSEGATFPAVSPDFNSAFWKPSLTFPIVFTGLKPETPIYVTPYVTAGLSQMNELNEPETAYKMKSTPKFDAGLDAKYSLTNNLTLDMTLNTDFAQVEADDQKINLTRFSLFFPEKRTFFLEKADVFDFSFLEGNNLFYSRRIGIYDGLPVRIYGGLRMTGRVNKWDLGILDMQTAPFEENPGENFGVFRTKRNVLNQNSFVGGILTSRMGMNGDYNLAYGIDGQFRVKGDEYLTVRLAQTAENDSVNRLFDLSPSRLFLQWERRNQRGFSYDFLYTYAGDRYNPGMGFEMMENYQGLRGILRYGWFPGEDAVIRFQKVSFTGVDIWNAVTGLQETASGELTWYFEAKKGFLGSISGIWNRENLADTLTLGNDQASVPPGRYSFTSISAMYNTSSSHALSANILFDAGSFYDGWKISLSAAPVVNIGSGFDLGLTYNLDFVSFPKRTMSFINHIVGLRGLLTLTTKTSLLAFVQYNTAVDKVLTNVRFRYNPREGNDFYIVYDEGLNTNILREIPTLPHSSGRTILLKYTYTFRF
ncbi:MAG: DUF5916 domain-containing protein [Bacteroidia bacterium]|nr:DUF5916 domain-containing protein [Bacteroidia bacterium]